MPRSKRIMSSGRYTPRRFRGCGLCTGLLCRGEGFRRKGWGVVCGPCRILIDTAARKSGLCVDDFELRDRLLSSRAQCQREGGCRAERLAKLPPYSPGG